MSSLHCIISKTIVLYARANEWQCNSVLIENVLSNSATHLTYEFLELIYHNTLGCGKSPLICSYCLVVGAQHIYRLNNLSLDSWLNHIFLIVTTCCECTTYLQIKQTITRFMIEPHCLHIKLLLFLHTNHPTLCNAIWKSQNRLIR